MSALFASANLLARPNHWLGGKPYFKFLLCSALQYRSTRAWLRYLWRDEHRSQLLRCHPALARKLHRPYLRNAANSQQKLNWLCDHYDWMHQHWPLSMQRQLYQHKQHVLTSWRNAAGQSFGLSLQVAERFEKEGELCLCLSMEQQLLATLVFTIHRHQRDWMISIGCLQGPSCANGQELVRLATKQCDGLRPKQAVLLALYALAHGYRIQRLEGVANQGHVYQARKRRHDRVRADYDQFWLEMGGRHQGDHVLLPKRLPRKCLSEVASNKRAQYRRRQALEDQLVQAIQQALPSA